MYDDALGILHYSFVLDEKFHWIKTPFWNKKGSLFKLASFYTPKYLDYVTR